MGEAVEISAIIPAHHAESFILRALDSVFQQERLPDEIIVVDDGPTDGTAARVRAYP